ncbi:MAG: hypothetical protein ACRCT8_00660 [Lacipirellulaceae bacterium]
MTLQLDPATLPTPAPINGTDSGKHFPFRVTPPDERGASLELLLEALEAASDAIPLRFLSSAEAKAAACGGPEGLSSARSRARRLHDNHPSVVEKRRVAERGNAYLTRHRAACLRQLRRVESWRDWCSDYVTPCAVYVGRVFTWDNGPVIARTVAWGALGATMLLGDVAIGMHLLKDAGLDLENAPLTAAAVVGLPSVALFGGLSLLRCVVGRWRESFDRVTAVLTVVVSVLAILQTASVLGAMHGDAALPGEGGELAGSFWRVLLGNMIAAGLAAKVCKTNAERAFASLYAYQAQSDPQAMAIQQDEDLLNGELASCESYAALFALVLTEIAQSGDAAEQEAEAQVLAVKSQLDARRAAAAGDFLGGDEA